MTPPELERRYIAAAKIGAHLLDVAHPEGGSKARFFIRHGFDPVAPVIIEAALLEHPAHCEFSDAKPTAAGMKYVFDGPLPSPDGRDPPVRTVWRLPAESAPYLVTAYPIRTRPR